MPAKQTEQEPKRPLRIKEAGLPTGFANKEIESCIEHLENQIGKQQFLGQVIDIILIPRSLCKETRQENKCWHVERIDPYVNCMHRTRALRRRLNQMSEHNEKNQYKFRIIEEGIAFQSMSPFSLIVAKLAAC